MNLVEEAFNDTDTGKAGSLNVLDVYQKLVAKINEKTGYTDFRLVKNPKDDTQWTLVDMNYLGSLKLDELGSDWKDIKDAAEPERDENGKFFPERGDENLETASLFCNSSNNFIYGHVISYRIY